MFNIHLYKKTMKQTWKLWFLLLLPSLFVVPLVFTVTTNNTLEFILFGNKINDKNFSATVSPVLFVGPSIFIIIVANSLFARDIESQNITFIMVTPLSKTKIFWTKTIYLYLTLWFGWIINLIILLFSIRASKNYGKFPINIFVAKLTLLWLWFSAISAISLISSTFFNKSVWSIATSSLIIIGSILINIIFLILQTAEVDKATWIKWLCFASLYTEAYFYNMDKLEYYLPHIIVLIIIFIICTIGAWQVFIRKDLLL